MALGDGFANLVADRGIEGRRGAFLPDFLMPALQRAVALAEMDGAAFAVAENLDLDVARPLEIFFEIERVVAERRLGLGARHGKRRSHFARRADDLHAAAAAAGGGLEHDRKAHLARQSLGFLVGADAAVGARHGRDAEFDGGALGGDLVAHQADMLGPRTDKLHVVLGENFGEARVLREKAVARMHGVGAGDLAGGKQSRDVEIAVLGGRRADADALVGEPHMHGVRIRGRMHRHRRNAELLARPQDAQCDLPSIGDQDFVEHLGLGSE